MALDKSRGDLSLDTGVESRSAESNGPPGELTSRAMQGIVASFGQNVGVRIIGFLSQLVLAKLLAPADFGEIGLALTVNAFIQPLMDFGIEDVLVSRRKSLHLWIGPAYALSITLGFVAAGALVALAPLAASLYRAPALTGLLGVMALSAGLYGFSIVPEAKLRSDLRFTIIANYTLAEMLGVQCMTLLLAWFGMGAYAFFLPLPLASAVRVLTFQAFAQVGFRGASRLSRWIPLLVKGSLVFGQRAVQLVREQGDYCLLGVTAGPEVVGAYFLAFRLASQPVYTLIRSLSVVLFPTFSHLSGNPEHQTRYAIQASRLLALVVTPLSFLLAAVAEPVIQLFFGPKWLGSAGYLQWLSVGLAFDVLPCVAGSLASARGLFALQLKLATVMTMIFLVSIVTGVLTYGATGVACGVAVTFALSSIVYSASVFRPLPGGLATLVRLWIEPSAISGLAVGAGALAATTLPSEQLISRIVLTSAVSLVAYLLCVFVLAPDLVRHGLDYVKLSRIPHVRPR